MDTSCLIQTANSTQKKYILTQDKIAHYLHSLPNLEGYELYNSLERENRSQYKRKLKAFPRNVFNCGLWYMNEISSEFKKKKTQHKNKTKQKNQHDIWIMNILYINSR